MVKLLVEAGAAVDTACGCAGAETALWAATTAGAADVVAYLLDAGADPVLLDTVERLTTSPRT